MIRVAGTDPGTSSLDVLLLEDGAVRDQERFTPEQLQADPTTPVRWLEERGPLDLVAGPSGYGLPLRVARDTTKCDLALMTLVRPEERGQAGGVVKFTAVVRAFRTSRLPTIFLPGVVHLPTIPAYRKINRIDLGTADKVSVAALALALQSAAEDTFCLVELGSAFSAVLVLRAGQVVAGVGGTSGPPGWGSAGAWDGELAYLLSPLTKRDLFQGGAQGCQQEEGETLLVEETVRCVAGWQAVEPFRRMVLSGRLLETQPDLARALAERLRQLGEVTLLGSLPNAWVKQAAQGAALLADGLAGGQWSSLVKKLRLREASGTVLDWLRHPRAEEVRRTFLEQPL